MISTDSNLKTARIPVKMIDGRFINQITGEEVAEIKNEAYCEIVVEADKVSNPDLLNFLMDEQIIELLPLGAILYASISSKNIPEKLRGYATGSSDKEKWVKIQLITPLTLKFRGTKPPVLLDCECEIPALKETDRDYVSAESLNHAYRLISTAFEPHRRSFGGSVFLKIFIPPQNQNDKWTKLADLRDEAVEQYFNKLKEDYQEFITKKKQNSLSFNAQIPITKIRLRENITNENKSWLDAKIDEKGNLVLDGYDIGEAAEKILGDSDYEYWFTVDKQYKDSILLLLIKDKFTSDTKFKNWLEKNGIPSEFDSWI
jgi:hypothetical protein